MEKITWLLRVVDEYNGPHTHTLDFVQRCADVVGVELDMDGWFIRGFGSDYGYCQAHSC